MPHSQLCPKLSSCAVSGQHSTVPSPCQALASVLKKMRRGIITYCCCLVTKLCLTLL